MNAEEMPRDATGPPDLVTRMRAASRYIAVLVAGIGALVLLVWTRGIGMITSFASQYSSMHPLTALALTGGGIALWLAQYDGPRVNAARRFLGAAILFSGALALFVELSGHPIRTTFLFGGTEGDPTLGRLPGGALLCLGAAVISFGAETRSGLRPAELFAGVASLGATAAVVGYMYGAESFQRLGIFTGTAVHAAPTCLLLALGLLLARPDRGIMRIVTRDTVGARLARRMIPAATLVPVAMGFLVVVWGSHAGRHGARGGAALLVTATAAVLTVLVLFTAVALDRAEQERRRDEDRLERSASELQRAIATRDEFLSVASHELRTPLTALKLQLDSLQKLLTKEPASADARFAKKVKTALRQTDRLTQIIDGLLDVSRIAMGRFRLQVEDFDAVGLVREVVQRFDEAAEGGTTPIAVTAPAALAGRWDRFRLEQVLANLIGNAVKYGTGKPVHVQVDAAGDRVELVVRDQGIGIAEADLARIFERFERAVPLRHYGGLGLGLYISHQIVRAHGGTISVNSIPGEGATFVVSLPRWTPPQDSNPPPSPK